MTEPERSAAQRLADEMSSLSRRDLPPEERERVLGLIRAAIDQGFTASRPETIAGLLEADFDEWPAQLAETLFDEVLADVELLPTGRLTEHRKRLERTHLAFLPSQSWSAMTVPAGDSYLIAIDQAVAGALYYLAKLMIVSWTVKTGGDDSEVARADADIPAGLLTRLARCYFGSAQVNGSYLYPSLVWITESQMSIALSTTMHAERFLIHHEAQHILHGHLDPGATTADAGVRQEIEADAGAVVATMARFVNRPLDDDDQFDLLTALCGIRLLFEAQDLVERAHFMIRPPSHPSPKARYETLREVALRAWVPDRVLTSADELTSTLVEICEQVRSVEPQPRHPEPLRAALTRFPNFPPNDDDDHWMAVDEIEETLRVLDLSIPQHLAVLGRNVAAPTFADQPQVIKSLVEMHVRQQHEEDFESPAALATLKRFGDAGTDREDRMRRLAAFMFDSTWGARVVPRVLRPAFQRVDKAIADRTGLSFDQLKRWVVACVPAEAVLPGVALLRRTLRDRRALEIISRLAAEDVTGGEVRLRIAAARARPESFVPDWTYQPGLLGIRGSILGADLVPAAAERLAVWLLEADEALWRFPADGGAALGDLYQRAGGVAREALEQGDSETVTAYLRLTGVVKPRHARLSEVIGQEEVAFTRMREILPSLAIVAGSERTGALALHLGTKAVERGWSAEAGQVLEFLEGSPEEFAEVGAELRALIPPTP